jgi:hypothetical protein
MLIRRLTGWAAELALVWLPIAWAMQVVQLVTVVFHLSLVKIMLLERGRMRSGLLSKICFAETVVECLVSCIGEAGIEN